MDRFTPRLNIFCFSSIDEVDKSEENATVVEVYTYFDQSENQPSIGKGHNAFKR